MGICEEKVRLRMTLLRMYVNSPTRLNETEIEALLVRSHRSEERKLRDLGLVRYIATQSRY